MKLTAQSLKVYREKKADFIPPLIPETYYGLADTPDDASMTDKMKNVGRSWVGGVGGRYKGMTYGGAAGGLAGLFHPFRKGGVSPAGKSWRALLDVLAYGAAGAAVGGTAGRLIGAKSGASPDAQDEYNVYDMRG